MAQDLANILPKNFGVASAVFADVAGGDELGAGITGGFAVLGYRGKVWRLKHRGEEVNCINPETGDALGSVEMVIVRAAATLSKVFYQGGFVDGSNSAPDCWSSNALVPDPGVLAPQCESCLLCPQNKFGARITESGKESKACSDTKRVAVVPLDDLENESYGGPMLLRIPAASLTELKGYSDKMKQFGFKYFQIGTRIRFDLDVAYPKLLFQAMRALDDDEAVRVVALRDDPRTIRILNEITEHVEPAQTDEQVLAGAFEQPPAPKAPAAAPRPALRPVVAARPAAVAPKPVAVAPKPVAVAPKPVAHPGGIAAAVAKPVARPGGIAAAVAKPTPRPASKPVVVAPPPPPIAAPVDEQEYQLEDGTPCDAEGNPLAVWEDEAPAGAAAPPAYEDALDEQLAALMG